MLIDIKGHKIFAFSDTHGMYRRLIVPAGTDILICAGDACEGFNPSDLQDFFTWYAAIPAELRIFVPGNHERIFDTDRAEGVFDREEFKDICICHAVHELCQHKMYSIPDLLRMNDFWCEVRVTHQLLSDRDGKRFSCIDRKK